MEKGDYCTQHENQRPVVGIRQTTIFDFLKTMNDVVEAVTSVGDLKLCIAIIL
jgi:hypothetical protein